MIDERIKITAGEIIALIICILILSILVIINNKDDEEAINYCVSQGNTYDYCYSHVKR